MIFNNVYIIWIIFYVLGFLFTFFYWIRPEWLALRKKNKIISQYGLSEESKKFLKNNLRFYHFRLYIYIIFLSMIITLVITGSQFLAAKGKIINDIYDVSGLLFPLVTQYTLLSGIRHVEGEEIDDNNNSLLFFKKKLLIWCIDKEKSMYLKCIQKNIKKWYDKENEEAYIAIFINRIFEKDFAEIISNPSLLKESDKEENAKIKTFLDETPLKIAEMYVNNHVLIFDTIIDFFEKCFDIPGIEIFKIITFVAYTEKVYLNCGKDKKFYIDNLKATVNKSDKSETKELTLEELDAVLAEILGE